VDKNVFSVPMTTLKYKLMMKHYYSEKFRDKNGYDAADQRYKNEMLIDDHGESRSMKFVKCTQSDLEDALKTIKSNSAGIDGLSLKAFEAVAAYLLPFLPYLVNLSMEKGQFPDALKQAKIIHLHKGGDKREMSKWRPTSILPLFSKIY
jgi:hypothetical protein